MEQKVFFVVFSQFTFSFLFLMTPTTQTKFNGLDIYGSIQYLNHIYLWFEFVFF